MTNQKIFKKSDHSESVNRQIRNAYSITITLMLATLLTVGIFAYFGFTYNLPQLFITTGTLVVTFFFDFYLLFLISRNKKNLAMMLVISTFMLNVATVPFIAQGFGFIIAVSIMLVILAVVGLTLDSSYSTSGIALAIISGVIVILLDNQLGTGRIRVLELERLTPLILIIIAIPISIILIREFNHFSLQSKITLGILLTGGITVATLVAFGVNRVNFINTFLQNKYQANITKKLESEISNTINSEANEIKNLLTEIQNDTQSLARYRSNIENQQLLLPNGTYWNATENVFQLPGGQLGNKDSAISSIYIPNTIPFSEALAADLNASINLDLLAPGVLESHPEVAAIYFISDLGYTVYYPNINLAANVPPDFDPTQQPFFTIAEPANDPEKLPRWTRPYQDPAGAGLIVTVSVPVYDGNKFEGVMSVDIQLDRVTQIISQIKIGDVGIPILVDETGVILAMSEEGYTFFGLEPEVVPFNESPKQTLFDSSTSDLQEVILQIIRAESGISKFSVGGVENYLSTTALEVPGYKLAFIAPVNELNKEVTALNTEVEEEVSKTIQNMSILLTVLFIGAFIASLAVGQIITRPLTRLTETVQEIAGGNFSSRAIVETGDETGVLAQSFNTMAEQLTETLQGLEDRITERTNELEKLSQTNAYRASLFESISRISRIINNTRSLEQLLPQITETISSQLGFYHVGIFLADVHKEYTVLVAANSEGGKAMLARNHRLRIGETGIVGYVSQSGSPRVVLDVDQDLIYFNNPDLPETRSEIALPLQSGSEIIGALDVQSKTTNAFSEEDVNILSVLADQVSIAIQNAQSFQNSLEALEKAERAAAQLSEQQWSNFHMSQSLTAYHFDGVTTQEEKPNQKIQSNHIAIPIVLRGIQIGSLKLSTTDPDRKWDNNEIAMVQATAERTALAIETARLLQEAQKRASKERTIGQISAKIGSLVNIENIVQTTIQELGDTLPGTDVAIQFTSGTNG